MEYLRNSFFHKISCLYDSAMLVRVYIGLLHSILASTTATSTVLLQRRVESESLPIFDFKKCITEILEKDGSSDSVLDCELMFNRYTEKLRDHYYDIFEAEIEGADDKAKLEEIVIWCRNECSVAMTAALPALGIVQGVVLRRPSHGAFAGYEQHNQSS